jgi:Ser/Thr protein kinase RdoA (MazF antagonist)
MKSTFPDIRKIIKSTWPDAKVVSITEFSEGYNNLAYNVCLKSGNYVVKIIKLKGFEKYLLKQNKIRTLIKKKYKNFPIAKIIKSDYTKKIIDELYIILEYIEGNSLQTVYKKVPNKDEVYQGIGELYGQLHTIKLEEYGELDENLHLLKTYESWYTHNTTNILKNLKIAKEQKLMSAKTLKICEDFLKKNKGILKKEIGPRLCHGDASDTNILLKNDGAEYKVSGIIDFEFSRSSGVVHELFSGLRGLERKFMHKDKLVEGYLKYSKLPKNWEKLALFYNWMGHLNQLTKISKMKWRKLSESQTLERKKELRKTSLSKIKSNMKLF